jgi:hypothetical protein
MNHWPASRWSRSAQERVKIMHTIFGVIASIEEANAKASETLGATVATLYPPPNVNDPALDREPVGYLVLRPGWGCPVCGAPIHAGVARGPSGAVHVTEFETVQAPAPIASDTVTLQAVNNDPWPPPGSNEARPESGQEAVDGEREK